MKDLTYQTYLNDPDVREDLEREVNRLRHEAIDRYIVAPLLAMLRRTFRRSQLKPTPVRPVG